MADSSDERLERARISLEGLSVGDALGGFFEMATPRRVETYFENKRLPPAPWRYTDDTSMALSIFLVLRQKQEIDQDYLAESFARRYDRSRGYGRGARHLLKRVANGDSWHEVERNMFRGEGSFGNGAGMRVPPIGAYFADDLNLAANQAALSSKITHSHPEGIAGAIAIAVATGMAWQFNHEKSLPGLSDFIDGILSYVPETEVKRGIRHARDFSTATVQEAATSLGSGFKVSCQDTIPFVLWCAGMFIDDYQTAIMNTMHGGGDVDTTCAMVGGIVVMFTGKESIPAEWLERREELPAWAFEE